MENPYAHFETLIASSKVGAFTVELIDEIITTAFEGGSNYWALLGDSTRTDTFRRNESVHYKVLDQVYQGGSLEFFDVETDEKLGDLTAESIVNGINVMASTHRNLLGTLLQEDYDADDADAFLQYCVMGEIVYG